MPPAFRAAILRFGQGNLATASDQLAGLFPRPLPCVAAVRTRRPLRRLLRVTLQFLHSELPSHHVPNADHGVLNVIDILPPPLQICRRFLRQQLRYQRLYPLLNQLVACHPWLLYLD